MNPTRTMATRWPPNRLLAVAAATVMVIGATACDDTSAIQPTTSTPAAAWTPTSTSTSDVSVETSVLSDDQVAGLLWMREEEQLAHDVYVVLGELWGLRIFEKTSQLDLRGMSYEPTQLDPATFEAIVSSEMERGQDS